MPPGGDSEKAPKGLDIKPRRMTEIGRVVDLDKIIAGAVSAVEELAVGEGAGALADPRVVHTDPEGVAGRVPRDAVPLQTVLAVAHAELEDAAFRAGGAAWCIWALGGRAGVAGCLCSADGGEDEGDGHQGLESEGEIERHRDGAAEPWKDDDG